MLTSEQNERITRTAPGSPAGDLFRRYWQPVALSEELPPGAREPASVQLLGEQLVLFRDEHDGLGLLGLHCSHRGADLSYGRVEAGGLRCLYHGWVYDVCGRCIEQPGEKSPLLAERIEHRAYPCREAGGIIFAYLGPGEPPVLPRYGFSDVPETHRYVTKVFASCNYLQGNEGNIDPQHVSFLHRQAGTEAWSADGAPEIDVETTTYGLRVRTTRHLPGGQGYLRVSNFIMPNLSSFPEIGTEPDGCHLHWHVPIDDVSHWKYIIAFRHSAPLDLSELSRDLQDELGPDYRLRRNGANRYLQDRDEMAGTNFAGMGHSFQVHDAFATESQGPIQDRPAEHLGRTDLALTRSRKLILESIDLVAAGKDPRHVLHPPSDGIVAELSTEMAFVDEASTSSQRAEAALPAS